MNIAKHISKTYNKIFKFYYKYQLRHIAKNFNKRQKNFNTINLDLKIAKYCDKLITNIELKNLEVINNNIAILASNFYDAGGHTECVKNTINSLYQCYKIGTFLTRIDTSKNFAPKKTEKIKEKSFIDGIESDFKKFSNFEADLLLLLEKIVKHSPRVIIAYIHMNDVYAVALLHLIKKYTKIKVLYFNHATHIPALGFNFADMVLEEIPVTLYVTNKYRGINRCHIVGLPMDFKENTRYYDNSEIEKIRLELGIKNGDFVTMTACNAAKLFDSKKSSRYFEMIKSILNKHSKIKHVIISDLNKWMIKLIDKIFEDFPEEKSRIIFHNSVANFDVYVQSCDVFIDSFPFSSALTQIDLMRNKKPAIVKVNNENAVFSFHEFMDKEYPLIYSEIKDIESAIANLMDNTDLQKRAVEINYNHYLKNFEGLATKNKYSNIIENSDNLEKFYDKIDGNIRYNLKIN